MGGREVFSISFLKVSPCTSSFLAFLGGEGGRRGGGGRGGEGGRRVGAWGGGGGKEVDQREGGGVGGEVLGNCCGD